MKGTRDRMEVERGGKVSSRVSKKTRVEREDVRDSVH